MLHKQQIILSYQLEDCDRFRAYVDVIVLKRSWPAVSHICSFTFSPSTIMVRILKSTPIVVMYVPAAHTRHTST